MSPINEEKNINGEQGEGCNSLNFKDTPPPIAIVGMGMRLPGGVSTSAQFWNFIMEKKDGRSIVPRNRYNIDGFYSSQKLAGSINVRHGYFLDQDLEPMDTDFFPIGKTEAANLDPQQRLLLEVVWECLESSGQTKWHGKDVGCFVGVFGEDWLDLTSRDAQIGNLYQVTGAGDFGIANRISYEYDLRGPSVTLRTACSSAMTALHEACLSIYNGACSSAVVCGTNLIITPTMTAAMCAAGALAPDGICKTFDAAANGYARGEAINALYIKRLDDALRDNDPIRAIIRSVASNGDGTTPGLPYPNVKSHESMIREAYRIAGIDDLSETCYIQCHGTGTAVGDPVETTAVANVLGGKNRDLYIGSMKPNFGHSEGASGITSVIGAVLSLEHATIPPNMHFNNPNPNIPFETGRLKVPTEAIPWPQGSKQRISVNSFGIGGSNVHVILESPASFLTGCEGWTMLSSPSSPIVTAHKAKLLVFSAKSNPSLSTRVNDTQHYLGQYPERLHDLAYTLGERRQHLPNRAFTIARSEEPWTVSPTFKAPMPPPSILMIFTGQGAQWPGMGRELVSTYDSFHQDMRRIDDVLQNLKDRPDWLILEELMKEGEESRVYETELSHALSAAVQLGVVNLLASWNIRPDAVLGHSSGEVAAAYAGGAISFDTAIIIAYYRGQINKKKARDGAMAAVGLGKEDLESYLEDGAWIACENSPQSTTISGDTAPIDKVLARIQLALPETFCRKLRVDRAYHSPHMTQLGEWYEKLLSPYVVDAHKRPTVDFFSSVCGGPLPESRNMDPAYWRCTVESRVFFSTALQAMLQHDAGPKVVIEVGPHSTLAGPFRQVYQSLPQPPECTYIPTLTRNANAVDSLLSTAGQLFQHGLSINFPSINGRGKSLQDLPHYSWQHDVTHWGETRVIKDWRDRQFPPQELLGVRVPESTDTAPIWRNVLRLESASWIADHVVGNNILFPCAGFLATSIEAMRQITGSIRYCLKNVVMNTALVLKTGEPTEMITALRQVKWTDSVDSDWYEFTMSTYAEDKWIKHCTGQIRVSPRSLIALDMSVENITSSFIRRVQSDAWYSSLEKVGLRYGPCFRGLHDISAAPGTNMAMGSVDAQPGQIVNHDYLFHPASLDQVLQLLLVAFSSGAPHKLGAATVPESIGELEITTASNTVSMIAKARPFSLHSFYADISGVSENGEPVLCARDVKLVFVDSVAEVSNSEARKMAQIEWKPDIDFLPLQKTIRSSSANRYNLLLAEKLCVLCILETADRVKKLTFSCDSANPEHLKKYSTWLNVEATKIREGKFTLLPEAKELGSLSSPSRLKLIRRLSQELVGISTEGAGELVLRVFENFEAILDGSADALDILMENDGLMQLYNLQHDLWDLTDFFGLLGHSNPTMKVLEIGAGTGGTSELILKGLVSPSTGLRNYSTYTFTDISSGFFPAAQDRFPGYTNIEYRVLDISKDPIEQGFEAGSYDLIVAANVLHATPSLKETLQNIKTLMAPGGRLLMQELCPEMHLVSYIIGVLPGWWLGESDGRTDRACVSPQRWEQELHEVGLSAVETVLDDTAPFQLTAHIVARNLPTITGPEAELEEVTLVCSSSTSSDRVQNVEEQFQKYGYVVKKYTLAELPFTGRDMIFLLDLDAPFFHELTAVDLQAFQQYLAESKSSGTLWITFSSQMTCSDPSYAVGLGFARTVRLELLQDFATLEVDKLDSGTCQVLVEIYKKFQRRHEQPGQIDDEYAVLDHQVHISRYRWLPITDWDGGEALSTNLGAANQRKLSIEQFGSLDSLVWAETGPNSLERDQVAVKVCYAGLNFKDLLQCLGLMEGSAELGIDGSGVITRVGPDVKHVRKGQRVMFMGRSCLCTELVVTEKMCVPIPDDLALEQAASMPVVYSTSIYALIEIGRLKHGETVLIHSAAGGVGLAAIQICQMIGTEIYATVGNQEKVDFLVDKWHIPRDHIFSSRDASFQLELLRATGGKGVDIVLNSLSGELLHASWKCVAEFGTLIEIGARDFIGNGLLDMAPLATNRHFAGLQIFQMICERPDYIGRMLKLCMKFFNDGLIKSIDPVRVYNGEDVQKALRHIQNGIHTGKVVVRMPERPEQLPLPRSLRTISFSPSASYLLVGGMGGLGQALAIWMVDNSARHLTFLSRSAGKSEEDQEFIKDLQSQGCEVLAIAGSVANAQDVERAVKASTAPVAGVIQLSMILRDRGILETSHEEWSDVLAPKVTGTWNLHHALSSTKLDFFVLISSITGLTGRQGQANYAAAGSFLDSFVLYRRQNNLPASVVDLGYVDGLGYISRNCEVEERMRATSLVPLTHQDVLTAVQASILNSWWSPNSSVGLYNAGQIITGLESKAGFVGTDSMNYWEKDIRASQRWNMEASTYTDQGSTSGGDVLGTFLSAVTANPQLLDKSTSLEFVTQQISNQISSLLLHPDDKFDPTASLAAMGADSMVRVEIRNWWRKHLATEISVFDIVNAMTVERLGILAIEGLRKKYE